MGMRMRFLPVVPLFLGGLSFAPLVSAAGTTPVECAANDNRVWVYDSLTSFSVILRLPCGEQVEIISRVKGYVKIRTADGKEGYVPDSAFPDLPPYIDPNSNNPTEGLASLIRSRQKIAAHPVVAVSAPASAPNSPVTSAAIVANPPESSPAAPPAIAASASPVSEPASSIAVPVRTPAVASASAPSNASIPAAADSTTAAVRVKPVSVAPKKVKPAAKKPSTQQPPEAPSVTPSIASSDSPASVNHSQARSVAARSNTSKASDNNDVQVVVLSSGPVNTTPRIESAVETKPAAVEANAKQPMATAALRPVADSSDSDSEDYPEIRPEDQSADPACQIFFSAYGLAPAQARWIAQERKKKYPGICPAASPAKVDFVMIFTHDVDIYNSTLPDPVHVDKNGFSDFNPVTTVDTALMPQAAADKAHHQFVWVFRTKRGAFDPSRFSPRRRPQFTKDEANSLTASHAADRSIEDAFQFMEEQGTTR